MGLVLMERDDFYINSCVEIKFGESQIGLFCSYQLSYIEVNFVVIVDILLMLREDVSVDIEFIYFRFFLDLCSDFVLFNNLDVVEKVFVSFFVVDEVMINNIEEVIRDQLLFEQWKKECKFRFIVLKFDLILKR